MVAAGLALLEKKSAAPNILVDPDGLAKMAEAAKWDTVATGHAAALNTVIEAHNKAYDDFDKKKNMASTKLKEHYLAEGHPRYREREKAVDTARTELKEADKRLKDQTEEIESIKTKLRQHGLAVEDINGMISSYLGHKELQIATLNEGYQILRQGNPMTGTPSEGEKTAIALCYFLCLLKAEGRQKKNLIVVLDDPISSLDTRSLNYAFNIIKGVLTDAGQLIVMTHNIHFMNEVKKWLKPRTERALKQKRKTDEVAKKEATAALLFLEVTQVAGAETRSASIRILPTLLREYDSEYHYLFDLVLKFQEIPSDEFHYSYLMPNAMRKVLDIFLTFKEPGTNGLKGKLENISKNINDEDAAHILALERLVQNESHADDLENLVSFSSMNTEESGRAAEALLWLIKEFDDRHYDQMSRICLKARLRS